MTGRYVALGSSMAAGPGITPRADGAPWPAGRSARNYSHLVASALRLDLVVASIVLARALANEQVGARLSLTQAATWRPVGAVGLHAALGAVLAVGLGTLLRHAAAVMAVLLLMPFVIEPLLGSTPRVGQHVGPLLPFTNAYEFTGVPWFSGFTPWWGPLGALFYFAGVVAVVFSAALFVINRRDPS
jgi:ABC-2 type transport system permease protein